MQSQLTKFLAVGLLALVLTCAVTVGESPAQWGRFATPYVVNYNYHAGPYPVYAWRPLGGLLAGVHSGVRHLLCHRCWQSPCCCVTPMFYDPCFDPCGTCCDSCCGFGGYVASASSDCGCFGGFGYSGSWGYYEQPASLSVGTPSPTGFGSVTPSDGVPGSRPVGTPATQRAAQPPYGPPAVRPSMTTTSPITTPNYPSRTTTQSAPDFTSPNTGPTRAPSPDKAFPRPDDDEITRRLDGIPPRGSYSPNDADDPPRTGTDGDWYNRPSPTDGSQQDSGTAPTDGFQVPTEPGTPIQPSTGTGGGSSVDSLLNLGTGTISVTVPGNAKVYINGYETRMTGTNRRYVVNDLEPGQLYDYEVRIVALVNGRTVEETQWVTLAGGQQGLVAFGKPQPQSDNMRFVAARPAH